MRKLWGRRRFASPGGTSWGPSFQKGMWTNVDHDAMASVRYFALSR